jgi:hypothetical protein
MAERFVITFESSPEKGAVATAIAAAPLRGIMSAIGAGHVPKVRASHVEPVNHLLRVLFRILRRWAADTGPIAGWTRTWRCHWKADLGVSGGPVLGPYKNRGVAIAAEIDWLERNVLGID